jgi:hypothetical protein
VIFTLLWPKQHCNLVNRDSGEQQLNREGVAEHVRVATLSQVGELEQPPQCALPVCHSSL